MRWLIVEDALRDRKGHWLEYVSTFVRELRALGDEVVVLCDRKAQGFVKEQTGALPVLPESIWHRMGDGAGALKRYLRVPGHALATFLVMRKVFRGFNHGLHGLTRMGKAQVNAQGTCAGDAFLNPFTSEFARDSENTSPTRFATGPAEAAEPPRTDSGKLIAKNIPATSYSLPAAAPEAQALDSRRCSLDLGVAPDWIFVPTVLVHHLLGWWMLLKTESLPKESRVLLFFPNLPIRLDEAGKAHWSGGPTTKLMACLFEQLRRKVASGKVVLGVETHAMRRALEGLIQIPVVYLPHPVEAAQPPRTDSGRLRTEVEDQNIDSSNNPLSAICHPPSGYAKPIVFGCYGAARWEKGSDIFLKAIRLVLDGAISTTKCTKGHEKGEGISTTIERQGGREKEQPKVGPKGEGVGTTELNEADIHGWGDAGVCLDEPSGTAFSNPSASELARDSENTLPTRSATGPAGALFADPCEMGSAGGNQIPASKEFLEGQSQAGLQMDNQKGPTIRTANDPSVFGEYSSFDLRQPLGASPCGPTSGCSSSRLPERSVVLIRDIRGQHSCSHANSRSPLDSLRFAIQWVEDFRDDSGNLVSIDPWLREHPQVEIIGRYFEGDEYERQLERTNVMVLPYRNPYQLRVSRVVIEAMINGVPVIATRGTTLFEQAEEYGVSVGCEDGDAESLAEAILEVAASFETMRTRAEEKANSAAQSFSVGYFRELLVMGQNDGGHR
jgi:hypothetical protein